MTTIFELTKKWLISHTDVNIVYMDPQIQFYIQYIKYICENNILGSINESMATTAACVYMICKHNAISKINIRDISAYYRMDEDTIMCNYRLVSAFIDDFYKKYACKITHKKGTSRVLCDMSIQQITDIYKKDGYICQLTHKESGMTVDHLQKDSEYIIQYNKKKNKRYIKLKN